LPRPDEGEIRRFLEVDSGYGYGAGIGSGDSAGQGYGAGYGWCSIEGEGAGSGEGFGTGLRDGRGYGDGCSDGCSVGNVGCDGADFGDGVGEYRDAPVRLVDDVPTLIYAVHGGYARGAILRGDLSLRPCYVARVGNCFAHGDTIREARCDAVEKDLKKLPVKERIASFVAAHPDPDAECSGRDLYDWHHILTGSCRMGRDEWCREHGLSPARARMTVWEFCRLTADAYGGATIRAVAALYGISIEDNGEQDDRD